MTTIDSKAPPNALPCPFCGEFPALITDRIVPSIAGSTFKIVCTNAQCFGPGTPSFGNADDVIAAWNRRALPSPKVEGFDETDLDMIRRGDMLGRWLGQRVYDALVALVEHPLPFHHDTEGYWEIVARDVATVTKLGRTAFVEQIVRMGSDEVIGFRVWDSRSPAPSPVLADEGVAGDVVQIPKPALDWLFGEGPDPAGFWFGDFPEDHPQPPGAFWWRTTFRSILDYYARTSAEKLVLPYRSRKAPPAVAP